MSLDLEQRYASIVGSDTDHVCTGNTAYRSRAVRDVGLFDESLGYGYDNDISYRLRHAGYRLALCRDARSLHRWREGLAGYLRQQYGFGYGRLDVVTKHPDRLSGDTVSRWPMMLHAPATALALVLLAASLVAMAAGVSGAALAIVGTSILAALAVERLAAGVRAARAFRTTVPLVFPVLHLGRDLAWATATVVWLGRRLLGRPPSPSHSMMTRNNSTW
jgi:cellulose synthase/poly-beta-1,6-N-acetylglucosamine synthase-like glycosyltransferase